MKQLFFLLSTIVCLALSSCDKGSITPPCDNTSNDCSLSLDWSVAYYYCTSGAYKDATPPMATPYNYQNEASALDTITNIQDANAFVCEINVKNDAPAQAPCLNPAVLKLYWKTPGPTEQVVAFTKSDSDMTVDYYEPIDDCSDGRPYFAGALGLPAGTNIVNPPMVMYTQASYTGN